MLTIFSDAAAEIASGTRKDLREIRAALSDPSRFADSSGDSRDLPQHVCAS
jgi:hypothetical protein